MVNEPTKLNLEDAVLFTNSRVNFATQNTSEMFKNTLKIGTILPGYYPKSTQWKNDTFTVHFDKFWIQKSTTVFWDYIFKNKFQCEPYRPHSGYWRFVINYYLWAGYNTSTGYITQLQGKQLCMCKVWFSAKPNEITRIVSLFVFHVELDIRMAHNEIISFPEVVDTRGRRNTIRHNLQWWGRNIGCKV